MSGPGRRYNACSLDSLGADEPMYGTATNADVWLLLEYGAHWTGNALRDSAIPGAVKKHLDGVLKDFGNSRLQLIKKQNRDRGGLRFYAALAYESDPKLYGFTLNGYEDLLPLDAGSITDEKNRIADKHLVLMCTNGEHDGCCGKFGMPVYLEAAAGPYAEDVWQSTHIGGHRFASTFVCLPHGIIYGRVREGRKANEIIGQYKNGRIDPDSLRGRSAYSAAAQAAEYFLRQETGATELGAFRLVAATEENGIIEAAFQADYEDAVYKVKLIRNGEGIRIRKSCGDEERSYVPRFSLEAIRKEPAD